MTTLRRSLEAMASRKSTSSQAFTPVRSISSTPGSSLRITSAVPVLTPMSTPTVESTTGTPNFVAALHKVTTLRSMRSRVAEPTVWYCSG